MKQSSLAAHDLVSTAESETQLAEIPSEGTSRAKFKTSIKSVVLPGEITGIQISLPVDAASINEEKNSAGMSPLFPGVLDTEFWKKGSFLKNMENYLEVFLGPDIYLSFLFSYE